MPFVSLVWVLGCWWWLVPMGSCRIKEEFFGGSHDLVVICEQLEVEVQ